MSLQCAFCGHTSDTELVSHINKEHGGLRKYMLFFPFLKVVSENLFTAIENSVYFRFTDNSEQGLNSINQNDRLLIIDTAQRQKGPRSEIYVESDF